MKRIISFILALFVVIQLWSQDTIEVINIENQAVQDYMADAKDTYEDNSDYRISVVTKYNNAEKYGKELDWPQGKLVKWTPTTAVNIKEVRITVSENSDYSNAYTYNPDEKGDSTLVIRNLLPNSTYFYKVEEFHTNGTKTELTSGKFLAVGQVRMIQVPNSRNIRDLGGWPTQYGATVKYGRLYRSGSFDRINKEGRRILVDNLKILAELDLRHEVKHTSSFLGNDKDYLRISHDSYLKGMTQRNWVYVQDLKWIIDKMKENKNVDWHCAIGCDRCGTLSFLIEGLLGLSELDLCRDYELSTFSLSERNKRVRGPLKSMLAYISTYGPADDLAQCFYNYWLSIGMEKDELNYFLLEMLDINSTDSLLMKIGNYETERFMYKPIAGLNGNDSLSIDSANKAFASTIKPLKHKVKKGETLAKIARKHGTTIEKLKKLNNLKSDLIREGQLLIVKSNGGKTVVEKKASSGGQKKTTYTIKKGDTLGAIAKHYKVSVSNLKKWNNLKSDKIYEGGKLVIYTTK